MYMCIYSLLMRANKLETALSRDRLCSLSGPTRYVFFMYVKNLLACSTYVQLVRIASHYLISELGSLSDDFYNALPHKRGQRSHPIDSKRLIAQKQDLCQVRGVDL